VNRASGAACAVGDRTLGELAADAFGGDQVRSDSVGESKLKGGAAFELHLTLEARVRNTSRPAKRRRGIAQPIRRYGPGENTPKSGSTPREVLAC
jgi:hypothetical protein